MHNVRMCSKGRDEYKLSLCLSKPHNVKANGGVKVKFYAFLNSTLNGDE
jgi:hypothetical protein